MPLTVEASIGDLAFGSDDQNPCHKFQAIMSKVKKDCTQHSRHITNNAEARYLCFQIPPPYFHRHLPRQQVHGLESFQLPVQVRQCKFVPVQDGGE